MYTYAIEHKLIAYYFDRTENYQCGSCEQEFEKPIDNECPHCGSGNFVEGNID